MNLTRISEWTQNSFKKVQNLKLVTVYTYFSNIY